MTWIAVALALALLASGCLSGTKEDTNPPRASGGEAVIQVERVAIFEAAAWNATLAREGMAHAGFSPSHETPYRISSGVVNGTRLDVSKREEGGWRVAVVFWSLPERSFAQGADAACESVQEEFERILARFESHTGLRHDSARCEPTPIHADP